MLERVEFLYSEETDIKGKGRAVYQFKYRRNFQRLKFLC